jgi:two-component system NarL family sensor kinase
MAPASLLVYIYQYNRRKKSHHEEKELMKLTFETELAKSELEVQEQTMQTVGADLHDNIGQLLSLTSLTLNSVKVEDPDKAQQKIEAAIELTKRSIKEMRLLGKLFHGEQLITLGLDKAIQYQVNWLEKAGQFEVNYTYDGQPPAAPDAAKDLIVFRIIQETLNNSIKHSSASRIGIHLSYEKDNLTLQITDNGIGFNAHDKQNNSAGMGLHNIYKRSGMIGGTVQITSEAGKGTAIQLIIPYTTNEH